MDLSTPSTSKSSSTSQFQPFKLRRVDLGDALECPVCLEEFTFEHKVLPCQHTFCKSCLEKIFVQDRTLKCPECRLEFLNSIDNLPNNIILVRILTCFEKAKSVLPDLKSRPKDLEFSDIFPRYATHILEPSFLTGFSNAAFQDVSNSGGEKKASLPVIFSHSPICQAKFDLLNAKENGCLSFKKGDSIFVRRRIDKNWAEGRLNDQIGIFPISFVEMNASAKLLMKYSMCQQKTSLDENLNENQKTPEQNLKLPYLYVAICPYKPQKMDELELKRGHIYLVAEKCHDGWYKGQSVRTLNWGMFPGNYVVRISSESNKTAQANSSQLCSKRNVFGPNLLINENVKKAANNEPPSLPPRGLKHKKVPFINSDNHKLGDNNPFLIDNPVFEDNLLHSGQNISHVRSVSNPDQTNYLRQKVCALRKPTDKIVHKKSGSLNLYQ